jgi:Tic22-like family
VAYNPEDIKARLSGVPVYAVINKREEFVLVAGAAVGLAAGCATCCPLPSQHKQPKKGHGASRTTITAQLRCKVMSVLMQEDSQKRNIGLFFFNRQDAESLIEKVSCMGQQTNNDVTTRDFNLTLWCHRHHA